MSGIVGDNQFRASGVVASSATDYDDDQIQSNIAVLGFYVAVNGSLTRYNLVDQSIDEYFDTSGVDAGNSTNEVRSSSAPYYYYGASTATPTITEDADTTTEDGDYTWYRWTTVGSGSYSSDTTQDHIWLVVAGGGGGAGGCIAADAGGGAGGGGYRYGTTLSLLAGNTYTIAVGDGGAGSTGCQAIGTNGGNSSITGTGITTITSAGGGGGRKSGNPGVDGGSGGASGYNGVSVGAGNTPAITQYTAAGETTTVQGFDSGIGAGSLNSGPGGGGACEVGENTPGESEGGDGGDGCANSITGSSVTYAGGGGGGLFPSSGTAGAGGAGGGGPGGARNSAGTIGTDGLGGGAGSRGGFNPGDEVGVDGGSGVVILRRSTIAEVKGGNLTLQSTDVTAEASPTYGELVMLIENAYGTATLNTDIKGYISRDSGSTFTQGTLSDEGSWGTNKQILGFHDLTLGGSASTAMCYKIETLNQSLGSKETYIYATSIGWK